MWDVDKEINNLVQIKESIYSAHIPTIIFQNGECRRVYHFADSVKKVLKEIDENIEYYMGIREKLLTQELANRRRYLNYFEEGNR